MSFQDKLEAHYQQTEAAETEAREIEGRIKQIAGAESLLLQRNYGRPLNRDAIARNLTLSSLIAKHDPMLAAYLGFAVDRRRAEEATALREMQIESLRRKTEEMAQKNARAAAIRDWKFNLGGSAQHRPFGV